MKNLKERKNELLREYKKKECRLLEVFEDEEKREQCIKNLAEALKIILEEYSQVKKSGITLEKIPLLYGLLSMALEGSVKIYFLSKQFEDLLDIEPSRRTLGNLKGKINKDILNEIGEKLDYLIFMRNHFVHFPPYYTLSLDDEEIFFDVIRFLAEKGEFYKLIPPELLEVKRSDTYEQK